MAMAELCHLPGWTEQARQQTEHLYRHARHDVSSLTPRLGIVKPSHSFSRAPAQPSGARPGDRSKARPLGAW